MKEIFQFALLGIGEGSLIAGIAISLVLFYRGSGTINLSTAPSPAVSFRNWQPPACGTSLWRPVTRQHWMMQ